MHLTSQLLSVTLALLLATPSNAADFWAQFCTNDDCTDCGQEVSMDNSGCLQQSGRKTVGIKGDYAAADNPGQKYKLVATPGDQCDCQSACESFDFLGVDDTSSCYSLPASDSDSDSQSFRWVAKSSCGNNTC